MGSTAYNSSAFNSGLKPSFSNIREFPQNSESKVSNVKIETYNSREVRSDNEEKFDESSSLKSSSSKKSEGSVGSTKYKSQMTLKEFLNIKDNQDRNQCSTFVMIKIIEKIEEEAEQGLLHSFSPENIYLINLNSRNFEALNIRFGAPIVNKGNRNDGLYLAPEVLAGGKTTEKSIVFTLAVIWDQLIHGELFFKSMAEISNSQRTFYFIFRRVQGQRLQAQPNPQKHSIRNDEQGALQETRVARDQEETLPAEIYRLRRQTLIGVHYLYYQQNCEPLFLIY
jgi:hypothetical protein